MNKEWLAFCIAAFYFLGFVAMVGGLAFARCRALQKGQQPEEVLRSSKLGLPALRMLTVALIVDAVLLLAVLDHLTAETTGTLLGGVAGYVLGGLGIESQQRQPRSRTTQSPRESNGAPVSKTENQ